MNKTITFIGAGNMGTAIINGMLRSKKFTAEQIRICDPDKKALASLQSTYPQIQTSHSNQKYLDADIVILCVKPQIYKKVIDEIGKSVSDHTLFISIAAGITICAISTWLGNGFRKIIRTMPNTPAMVFEGMTAICPGEHVMQSDIDDAQEIFASFGRTILMSENTMDVYTSLAGSSPAWIFILIEAMADGAVKEGMGRDDAYMIAAQAVRGAATLVLESKDHPAELKDKVCSPGGTTIAGVAALEASGYRTAIIKAMQECTRKAREIGTQ